MKKENNNQIKEIEKENRMLKEGINDEIDNLRDELKKIKKRNKFLEKKDNSFQRVFDDDRRIFKEQQKEIKVLKQYQNSIKQVQEELKELKSDDLANWYKEHAKYLESLSSMEICNGNYNCNKFVVKKLKERFDKIFKEKFGEFK